MEWLCHLEGHRDLKGWKTNFPSILHFTTSLLSKCAALECGDVCFPANSGTARVSVRCTHCEMFLQLGENLSGLVGLVQGCSPKGKILINGFINDEILVCRASLVDLPSRSLICWPHVGICWMRRHLPGLLFLVSCTHRQVASPFGKLPEQRVMSKNVSCISSFIIILPNFHSICIPSHLSSWLFFIAVWLYLFSCSSFHHFIAFVNYCNIPSQL